MMIIVLQRGAPLGHAGGSGVAKYSLVSSCNSGRLKKIVGAMSKEQDV